MPTKTMILPSNSKKSLQLIPIKKELDKVPHGKKICKQKRELGRIKTKRLLKKLCSGSNSGDNFNLMPCSSHDERSVEMASNNVNVVVSQIENFVLKKSKRQLYKKQMSDIKKQLLRNSGICDERTLLSKSWGNKQITIKEKSFLDVTSFWTD